MLVLVCCETLNCCICVNRIRYTYKYNTYRNRNIEKIDHRVN